MSKYLRINEVAKETGISKSTIYWFIRKGVFPKPAKVSNRISVWTHEQVEEWKKERNYPATKERHKSVAKPKKKSWFQKFLDNFKCWY